VDIGNEESKADHNTCELIEIGEPPKGAVQSEVHLWKRMKSIMNNTILVLRKDRGFRKRKARGTPGFI
jgi:hypothetical protein